MHGVAVKPGKPMLIGRLDRSERGQSAYVGLPGYPVSALTIFRTFVAPAIREAAGKPEPRTATVTGRMASRERYGEGRMRLMPAGLLADGDGETLVYPVDKGSGATTSLVEADGVVVVGPDTDYLAEGERVDVELFSPDVRAPTLLGVGEDDPALNRLLDAVDRPRYLPVGSREGLRRLRDGLPDVAVTAGPVRREVEAADLGGWERDWGLLVPADNPAEVSGVADLVDRDLRFVNRTTDSGLRTSLANRLADLADGRGVDRREATEAIDGFELAVRAFESPARKVAAGDADVGLGLRASAAALARRPRPTSASPAATFRAGLSKARTASSKPSIASVASRRSTPRPSARSASRFARLVRRPESVVRLTNRRSRSTRSATPDTSAGLSAGTSSPQSRSQPPRSAASTSRRTGPAVTATSGRPSRRRRSPSREPTGR